MIRLNTNKKIYDKDDILGLNLNDKIFKYLKLCLEEGNDYEFVYPDNLSSSEKRIYKAGFLKLVLNHLYWDLKKSTVNEMLRENFDVQITDRNINRNLKKFKDIF